MKRFILAVVAFMPGVAAAQSTNYFGTQNTGYVSPASTTPSSLGQSDQINAMVASLNAYIASLNAAKSPQLTQGSLNAYYQNLTLYGPGAIAPGSQSSVIAPTTSTTSLTTVPVTATAAVPEPASWMMMILGVGLMGLALRRRAAERLAPAIAAR